jgi:LPXTG-motif cell wall-anchored protein
MDTGLIGPAGQDTPTTSIPPGSAPPTTTPPVNPPTTQPPGTPPWLPDTGAEQSALVATAVLLLGTGGMALTSRRIIGAGNRDEKDGGDAD